MPPLIDGVKRQERVVDRSQAWRRDENDGPTLASDQVEGRVMPRERHHQSSGAFDQY